MAKLITLTVLLVAVLLMSVLTGCSQANKEPLIILQIGEPLSPQTPSPLPMRYEVPSKAEEYLRIAPISNIIDESILSTLEIDDVIRFELFDGKEIQATIVNKVMRKETLVIFAKIVGEERYHSIIMSGTDSSVSVLIDYPTDESDYVLQTGKDGQLYLVEYEYGHVGAVS